MPSILLYRLSSISSLSATIAIACISNSTRPPPLHHHTNETEAPPYSRIDTISFKE